jgi:hypothetical protein
MQYNYFSGRSVTDAWSQYLIGETDMILTNHKDAQSGDYSWDLTDADNDGNLDNYAEFNPLFQQCLELFHKSLADTGNTAYGKLTAPYSTADNPVWCNGCSHYDNPENATGANFFSCIMKQDWFKAEAERNGWVSAWSEENLLLLFNELHYANKVSNNHLKTKLTGELDMGKIFTGAYSWDLTDVKNNSTGAATADGGRPSSSPSNTLSGKIFPMDSGGRVWQTSHRNYSAAQSQATP